MGRKADHLEPYLSTPTGGQARRCQARNRTGEQCKAPARGGFQVCARHGAGTRAREERGERKPAGRPIVHGLYSQKGLLDIQQLGQEILALEADLDNTDGELALLKATASYLLAQADQFKDKGERLQSLVGTLLDQEAQARAAHDLAAALELAHGARAAQNLHREVESFISRLSDILLRIINAVKLRAETRAKTAEAKALETFLGLCSRIRELNLELMDADTLDVWEERLRREVLLPNRLQLEVARA